MARPITIDDTKLLEAAREVFLELGASATTAEVARRAGISQGSIFKRFPTKQELFLTAMQGERDRRDWDGFLRRRTEEAGLRTALVEIGVELIGHLRQIFPLMLLSWSNRGEFGFSSERFSGPMRGIHFLADFLAREMEARRLRRTDPWSAARVFFASLQSYVLTSLMFEKGLGPGWSPKDYVTGIVDVLWNGIAPPRSRLHSVPPKPLRGSRKGQP